MLIRSSMRNALLLAAAAVMAIPMFQPSIAQAAPRVDDVINMNLAGVPREFRRFFRAAEEFWDNQVFGYSRSLPREFASILQQRDLDITATMTPIDGVGGVLGAAAPNETISWTAGGNSPFGPAQRTWVVPRTASAFFDVDDFGPQAAFTDEQLTAIVIHEIGHALGFGSLWAQNGFIGADGNYDFDGFALQQYRAESGEIFAASIPVEMEGGGGTAGGHWEDGQFDTDGDGFLDFFPGNFFNQTNTNFQTEYMLGSINTFDSAGNSVITPKFLSNSTLGSLEDIGWATSVGPGFYDESVEGIIKWGQDIPPFVFRPSVPEPGSTLVLLGIGVAALARRKRA